MIDTPKGLGGTPMDDWPGPPRGRAANMDAIDRLKPGSDLHKKVLEYLKKKLHDSERSMANFYARWQSAEIRHQAYLSLPEKERQLKRMADTGNIPEITSIVVPYSMATINVIVTYLLNVFTGRKPMFTLGTYNKDFTKSAQYQEQILQQNADHTRLVRHMYQFLNDGQVYGLGVMRVLWKIEKRNRTKGVGPNPLSGGVEIKGRFLQATYEGNDVLSIDPFMFFPDPRVPMVDVARKGEFVFWRTFEARHRLLIAQKMGDLKWVLAAGDPPKDLRSDSTRNRQSQRNAQTFSREGSAVFDLDQIDQGTIFIIPAELGLSEAETPEQWMFTIANKRQIIQAEPFEYDHSMHPVVVNEPYTNGYGFGHNSMVDYLSPIQDAMSWLVNSRMYNVRAALNNMFLADPSRIEIEDLKGSKPGKIIRVKAGAYGQDVRTMLSQLQVADVTQSHVQDLRLFMQLGDVLSAVTDAMKGGQQDSGGRKTAVEVRTKLEASASRLASMARLISAQGVVDLAEQMSENIMQFMSQQRAVEVFGKNGLELVNISPGQIVGDFYYPVHDGTLPIDKVAMLDVWKELYIGILKDPQLRTSFDIVKLLVYIADLGGARNLDQFQLQRPQEQVMPDEQVEAGVAAGNLVPLNGSGGQGLPTEQG